MFKNSILGFALVLILGLLAACDTAEERAEKHYQMALQHLENGDIDRAIVEFRSVFKLNGSHKDARLSFARMQRERGAVPESYAQYLRLVEQYPDNLEGRRALAEMAIETGDWDEVERHGRAAAELAPDEPAIQSVLVALDYRSATVAQNDLDRTQAFEEAQALLETDPSLLSAHQVVVDKLLQDQNWPEALAALDAVLAVAPDIRTNYMFRLGVLEQLGDTDGLEDQLRDMVAKFPDDEEIGGLLLNWYLTNDKPEEAERLLRERIVPDAQSPDDQIALIQFLYSTRGLEPALAEIESAVTTSDQHAGVFRSLRAAFMYESGDADRAIAELEDVLSTAKASAETNDIRTTLARMLVATGNTERARELIDEVLTSDRRHVEAIRMKATWLIEEDNTGDALALLRIALGESPRDAQLMTLLASVHEREGNRDLMAEMLSLAVEASESAPDEALRYAAFLVSEGQGLNAEAVLIEALRQRSENIPLLGALGSLYIDLRDWPRATGVIDRLKQFGDETAGLANGLTARMLAGQGNEDALQSFFEDLSARGEGGLGTELALIRALVDRGEPDVALARIEQVLEENPSDPGILFVKGSVLAMGNRMDEAQATFEAILQDQPETEQAWMALYRIKTADSNPAAAKQVLDDALATLPDSINLRWIKAGALEQQGDIDAAIDVYEALYAQDSSEPVFANNLASLLASHRDTAESLERAYVIARRLRGTDVPAFQDTYGWIAYRRGSYEEALTYLEPAAEGLPDDPMVQFHLAATLAALGRTDDALELLGEISEMSAPPALQERVQSEIARLTAPPQAPEASDTDN